MAKPKDQRGHIIWLQGFNNIWNKYKNIDKQEHKQVSYIILLSENILHK